MQYYNNISFIYDNLLYDSCNVCTDNLSKLVEGDYSFISWLCGIGV